MPTTLTSLPAELRIQIYALALSFPGLLSLLESTTRHESSELGKSTIFQAGLTSPINSLTHNQIHRRQAVNLSLLRVNKAISSETIPIFYAENRFILPLPHNPIQSDSHINSSYHASSPTPSPIQKHASHIRHLILKFTPPTPSTRPTYSPLSPPFAPPASLPPAPPSTPAHFKYLESLLQGWESHIRSFLTAAEGQMSQLRCVDIDAKSLIELAWQVRGYEWERVAGVVEGFRAVVGEVVESVRRGEEGYGDGNGGKGKKRCKVRVLFTREWWCVGVYENMFREMWGGTGVEFLDVDRVV